jgi:hypothetical protein
LSTSSVSEITAGSSNFHAFSLTKADTEPPAN